MMEWIVSNWYLILAFIVVGVVLGYNIKKWLERPTSKQIESVKKWLLYAVTEAEATLGEKTGRLKLHMVYDMAITKFGWLSFIPFETFSGWVDDALIEMKDMLKNKSINAIVQGGK